MNMKKLINFFLVISLVGGILVTNSSSKVLANPQCGVNDFTLADINNDKSLTVIGCYPNFEAANNALKANSAQYANLIVTHQASRSPSKIIAASRAVAYSYTPRWGSGTTNQSTSDIWRNANRTGESTYISSYYDMAYYETTSYDPSDGSGTIKVQTSGFIGHTRLIQSDIVPYIYIENGWSIQLGGQTYNEYYNKQQNQAQPFSVVPNISEFRVVYNKTYQVREIGHYVYRSNTGKFSSYTYGMAPDWLKEGTYYSWDMMTFYYDKTMKNPVLNENNQVGKYYNYYQYLPWRTSSVYDGKALDDYLELAVGYKSKSASVMYREGAAFFEAQNIYGVNGLLTYALAIHESGHGTSSIAKGKNNLFGWGAHDANPSDAYLFASISQSVSEHMGRNLRGYLSSENWRYFGQVLGNNNNGFNTKYASDPFWGSKTAGHAYKIDRYNGFKDYGQYQLIVVNKGSVISIKKEASVGSPTLTNLRTVLDDQVMIMTNIKKEGSNTFVEVMSPMPVVGGNPIAYVNSANQVIPYDWNNSVGYLVNEPYTIIYNNQDNFHKPNVYNMQLLQKPSIAKSSQLEFSNGKLVIDGYHYQEGISIISENQLNHQFVLIKDAQTKVSLNLSTKNNETAKQLSTDKRFNSALMGLQGSLDLKDLALGLYQVHIESKANIGMTPISYSAPLVHMNVSQSMDLNNKTFSLISNASGHVYLNVTDQTQKEVTDQSVIVLNQLQKEVQLMLDGSGYTYESSDSKLVSVSTSGVVKALASGVAKIIIKKDGDVKAEVFVVVYVKGDSFDLNKTDIEITKHDQVEVLTSSFIPESTSNKELAFVSLNNYMVNVNHEGVITPKNNGKTKILVISKADPALIKEVNVRVEFDKPITDPGTSGLLGDVNGDGKLSITDLVILHLCLSGLDDINQYKFSNADMDKNGKLTITDLVMLHLTLSGINYD